MKHQNPHRGPRRPERRPAEKNEREAEGVIVPGRRAVTELIRHARDRVLEIYVQEGSKFEGELAPFAAGQSAIRLNSEQMDERFGELSHQGIAVLAKPAAETTAEDIVSMASGEGASGLVVILDQVSDPHNFGAVLRAAEGAGADGVVISDRRSAPLSSTARKASAGASELIPVARAVNLQRLFGQLKEAGFWIIGADAAPGSTSLYDYKFPEKTALVFGSEGQGLRKLTRDECDVLVHLPMYGLISSLNVSQAASVFLFRAAESRKRS